MVDDLLLQIPFSSGCLPRKASVMRSSATAALHPATSRFRMVTGRPHPSEQQRGGSCYKMPLNRVMR